MSLDTKYRPLSYSEVLGQTATMTILRRFVEAGKGFHQSYLFAGGYGSGKTTLGRILGRALLCDEPQEGAPCNECPSCRSILENGSSDCFTEYDAATNSGKADIKQLTDDLNYDTYSGKQRIILFDEAHQLSKDALDALLNPLEENIRGSGNKKLVCIFCTTEPEKMRATVLSRCAPAFVIEALTPEVIATRLQYVCETEGIEFELEALQTIASVTECHIRDALKAVEGVSLLGSISMEHVSSYLQLDLIGTYLQILGNLGLTGAPEGPNHGLLMAFEALDILLEKVSPSTIYRRLAEASMLAYQIHMGATKKPVVYWKPETIKLLALKGDVLLNYAGRLASRPGRPTGAMLKCDLAALHHGVTLAGASVVVQQVAATPSPAPIPQVLAPQAQDVGPTSAQETSQVALGSAKTSKPADNSRSAELSGNGTWVDNRAVAKSKSQASTQTSKKVGAVLDTMQFAHFVVERIAKFGVIGGHTGRHHMDRH